MGGNSKWEKLKNMVITAYDFTKYVFTYYKTLWWDHKFTISDLFLKCDLPFGRKHLIDDSLNLVFMLPELQPRYSAFESQSHIKFCGPSIDEEVRAKLVDMKNSTEVIENFLRKNQINSDDRRFPKIVEQNDRRSYYDNYDNKAFSDASNLMRSESSGENFKKYHKPIIYVSMGTVFNNENLEIFEIIVETLLRQLRCDCVNW